MGEWRGGFITADEPPVITKPLFDTIVVEDSQSGGYLANATDTDWSDWLESFHGADGLFSTNSPRPNNILGAGGDYSPRARELNPSEVWGSHRRRIY